MAKRENNQNLPPPTPQTPEALAALAERLLHHADNVRNPGARAIQDDMREASRIIGHLRAGIHEIIQTTKDEVIKAYLTKLLEGV